jgi:hypothetical protein
MPLIAQPRAASGALIHQAAAVIAIQRLIAALFMIKLLVKPRAVSGVLLAMAAVGGAP